MRRQWAVALPLAIALAVVPAGSAGPAPALVLSSADEAAVAAVRTPELARRGDPLAFVQSARDLVGTVLPCSQVAGHLGIPLPTFPALSEWARVCGAVDGRTLFDHPVPSIAAHPPLSEDPDADQQAVTVVWLPPGTSVDDDFHAARARGLVWMTLQYGGRAAEPVSDEDVDTTPRDDVALLTWPSGRPLGVQWMDRGHTRLAWPGVAGDHRFWVAVNYPGPPVRAVDLLRTGVNLPT